MTADGYALLVVDMQNGFCHPDGSFPRIGRGLEGAMDAVRTAAVAVGQARLANIPVVFTRHVYRPGRPDEGAALIRNSPELAGAGGLANGTWDAEVCAELGCGPADLVVDKVRFDAFQWTSLEPLLRGEDPPPARAIRRGAEQLRIGRDRQRQPWLRRREPARRAGPAGLAGARGRLARRQPPVLAGD